MDSQRILNVIIAILLLCLLFSILPIPFALFTGMHSFWQQIFGLLLFVAILRAIL